MATRKQATKKAAKKAGRGKKGGNPFAPGGRFYKGDDDKKDSKKSSKGNPFKKMVRGKK